VIGVLWLEAGGSLVGGWTWEVESWAGHSLERMIHETGVKHTNSIPVLIRLKRGRTIITESRVVWLESPTCLLDSDSQY
jgi:hypothetical protein